MPWTMEEKFEAERRFLDLLSANGLPQPDAVEYGYACLRFFFEESKTCVVVDLEPDDSEPNAE